MVTKALRLYGKNDIRLEEFLLPPIRDDEILAKVISDSLCMSSYKAVIQGGDHKRVPSDVRENPIILGHEFCGEIIEVGEKWQSKYRAGDKFVIQPALNYKGSIDAPGYSFPYIGGCATYIVIPKQVMELGCLLPYHLDAYFYGSLAEPMSCVVGSFKEFFHMKPSIHEHEMGIKEKGTMAILAGAGPMGLGAIDYAIHGSKKPSRLVVTDINDKRLTYAKKLYTVEDALKNGVELIYINTSEFDNADSELIELNAGKKYDDVLVMAPVRSVVELADRLLGTDGCLSFFAGPSDTGFSAMINFYNIHYGPTHFIGTVGGNSEDMIESIEMIQKGSLNPAGMVTHVGGLDSAGQATINLPNIPGGKKLIYTQIQMDLTAIDSFEIKGRTNPLYKKIADIISNNKGLWCHEAEKFLLSNAKSI